MAWNVFSLLIALSSCIKTINLLKVNTSFGIIVDLVVQVFYDTLAFLGFYSMWLFYFCIVRALLGSNVDTKAYPQAGEAIASFMTEYRNSVGDITPPKYEFWVQEGITNNGFMIFLNQLYFIWFQVFMNIVLLNFLIAIIS